MQSDNDSGFIAREFVVVLKELGARVPPDQAALPRGERRDRAAVPGAPRNPGRGRPDQLVGGGARAGAAVQWYNEERLHNALGYLPPVVVYRGNPEERKAERRRRLAQARHRRRAKNLGLHQGTLQFKAGETVANPLTPSVPLLLKQFLPIGGRSANPNRVKSALQKRASDANFSLVLFSR